MCRGRVTGLGVPLAVPGFVKSDLLFDRGVLAERPRAAIPGAKVPGPLTLALPRLLMLPRLLLLLKTLLLLPLLLRFLLGLLLTGLSNSVLPEEQRDP